MMEINAAKSQSLIREKLATYSPSNLQKLDKLITLFVNYLQLKGVHLDRKVWIPTIVLSYKRIQSESFEVFEVKELIAVLNDLVGHNFFTLPFEKNLADFTGAASAYSYMPDSEKERHLRHWYEFMSQTHHLGSIEELKTTLIIEYNFADTYKILIDIQENIKNVLSERTDRGNRELFSDEDGEVSLDKYIILSAPESKKPYLKLKVLNSSKFEKKSVQPRTANIINFLYRAVVNKHDRKSYTTKELAEKFTETQKSTGSISNQIKAINDLCDEFKVKQVFHKNIERKWQLNPDLDCGKLIH